MSSRRKRKSDVSLTNVPTLFPKSIDSKEPEKTPEKPPKRSKKAKPVDPEEKAKPEATPNGETNITEPAAQEIRYWLMKAEPDSRIVKGKVLFLNCLCSITRTSNSPSMISTK